MAAITYNMEEEQCNTSLGLAIGGCGGDYTTTRSPGNDRKLKHQINFDILFVRSTKEEEEREEEDGLDYMAGSRSRKSMREDDAIDRSGSNNGDERRKKLKLSPEQSAFLEENFKEHSTLNPMRKQDLAERLGLKPRQVEIWFQNRRARTKLKQTEVNCELLKKCCDNLRDENQRLKWELQDLKSTKAWASSHIQLQRAVVMPSICISCKLDMFSTVGSNKNSTVFNGADLENSTRIYKCDSKDSSLTC